MKGKSLRIPIAVVGGVVTGALLGSIRSPDVRPATPLPTRIERGTAVKSGMGSLAPVHLEEFDVSNPSQPNRHGLLAMRVADANVAELSAIWDVLAKEIPWSNELTDLVMLRWTALDPASALVAAEKGGHPENAWWSWGCNDPEAALAAARSSPYNRAVYFVLQAIAQNDPARAQELLAQYPSEANSIGYFIAMGLRSHERFEEAMEMEMKTGSWSSETFREWANRDPDRAMQWFMDHRELRGVQMQKDSFFKALMASHPEKAEEFLTSLPAGSMKYRFQEQFLESLASTNPDRAIALAREEKSPSRRADLLASVAKNYIGSDREQALDFLREIATSGEPIMGAYQQTVYPNGSSGGVRDSPRSELISDLITIAPQEVMAIAMETSSESSPAYTVSQIAEQWRRNDPEGLWSWLPTCPAGMQRDVLIAGQMSNLYEGSPSEYRKVAALVPLMQNPADQRYTNNIYQLVRYWQGHAPEDFRNYLTEPGVPVVIRDMAAKFPPDRQ